MSVKTMLDMTGKVVIITGGGRGVGRGISEVFLDACAHVIIYGRSKSDDLPAVNGNSARFCATDVKDPAAVQACVDFVVEKFGRLDCLVNNAGGTPEADSATMSPRFNEAIIKLNLVAPFTFAQAANALMQQ